MKRKFWIEYREFESDEKAHLYETFYYKQNFYQKFTIKDVKEYVKEQMYKKHKPVCSCFLTIRRIDYKENIIYECYKYNDSTFLNDTIFNESMPIQIVPRKEKKCTCGQYDRLILSSNFEKQIEEINKKNDERERNNKEYYDRRLRDDQNEIHRLQNQIDRQYRENQRQMANQNERHREEINRIINQNNRREEKFNEERRANNEKFENIEYQRNQERKEYNEKLKTIENERERERKEYKEKFENIEYQRSQERDLNIKRFNDFENQLKEKDAQLKKNTQKLEENENQKRFLEKCKKDAEDEFITKNGQIYNDYFEKNKNLISEEFKAKIKELIDKKISFENINEDFILKIVKNEKFQKIVKDFIDDQITSLKDENIKNNISSFNIIILGNTGVGKSTLLNTVLKEKLAKTDLCDACTMGVPKPYESEKAKGVRIWDSRGIENGKYNLEIAFNDIKNTIESLIKENDPDKFIHCIWYCVCSNRFTEEEINNLKKCYDSYIEKLPIIVVFTQSQNQIQTDKMIEKVKNKLEKAQKLNGFDEDRVNDIKILKVLAEDFEHDLGVIKSFGIHNLMEQTLESSKIGIERACTHSLMEEGKEILREEFNENIKKLKNKIFENKIEEIEENNYLQNIMPNDILIEENKKKNNLNIKNITNFNFSNFKKFFKMFSREIMKKLLLKDYISEETISEIDIIIEEESRKVKEFFENIFLLNLDNISNNLSEKLIDFVFRIETKYKVSSLSSKYNYNELKRQSKNFIINNFKPKLEDIVYRDLSLILFQRCAEKISNELMECFNELMKNNKRIRETFNSRGKENSLICLKKIKKLMDYPNDDYEERNPKKKAKKKSKYEDFNDDEDDDEK